MSNDFSLESIQVSSTPQKRFEEYLQSRGKRCTDQRRMLVDYIFSTHEHFDAESLIAQLPRKNDKGYVSRATVFRTLKDLVDAGLLNKLDLGSRTVFEHDYGYPSHDHLHCTKCDQLIEFQSEELRELRQRVAHQHQFRVTGHRLIISGICEECARSKRRQRRPGDMS